MRVRFALLLALPAFTQLPPPAARTVDFVRDVQPLLAAKCGACHSGAKPQAGLGVHTRDHLLKGGATGPAVLPGKSADSLLVQRVAGLTGTRMPPAGDALSENQIALLRAWIDQGAQAGARTPAYPAASLELRPPHLPPAPAPWSDHPVDRILHAYFQSRSLNPPPIVSDAVFARRAYLDAWGLLPPPAELESFLDARSAAKRAQLVERLLAHNQRYAEHWISFWNDLLRNDEGVAYHGGRKSITPWLLDALQSNLPYDAFVSQLLHPGKDGPDGFLIGVNWRGDVSASQTPPLQAAMNSAQVFLGANLKCAACHDSFVSRWKLRQTYGLAAFFSDGPLKLVRCDVELDEVAGAQFLFPELGGVAPGASLEDRRKAAAALFTSPANGRFPRTLVNRLWKQLFGRALVEPVDDLDGEPWNSALLDWLAWDFVQHGYDIKHTVRLLMTSRAYQLASHSPPSEDAGPYLFRGPLLRRISAEQFVDGISQVTGEWRVLIPRNSAPGAYAREWRFKSSPLTRALGRPIRDQVYTERAARPTTLQALELVNGRELSGLLRRAARRMLGRLPRAPAPLADSGNLGNGAARLLPSIPLTGIRKLYLLLEDMESYDPQRVVAGWGDAALLHRDGSLTPLASLSAEGEFTVRAIQTRDRLVPDAIVPRFPSRLGFDIAGKGFVKLHAGVAVEQQPSALGILPNVRFFIFGEEPVEGDLILASGDTPLPRPSLQRHPDKLIDRIWLQAYARSPLPAERTAARRFLGTDPEPQDLEDLLWSVFLSPEYQFIR